MKIKTIKTWFLLLIILFNMNNIYAKELSVNNYQQLFDMVTYGAYNSDVLLNLNNEVLSKEFVGEFLVGASNYTSNNNLLNNKEIQKEFIDSIFEINYDEKNLSTDNLSFREYIGMKIMHTKKISENTFQTIGSIYSASGSIDKLSNYELLNLVWLDKRIVINYKIDNNAKYGIKITDFTLHGELLMEKELNEYFNSNFTEYINSKLGFSIMFPSVFSHEDVIENQNGIFITTKDKTATLSVKCYSNNSNLSAEEYSNVLRQENNNVHINSNNQSVSMLNIKNEDFVFNMYIFTKDIVYQTEMIFDKNNFEDFSMYTQYIINTFKTEEKSQG